jgi:hypothetical protein
MCGTDEAGMGVNVIIQRADFVSRITDGKACRGFTGDSFKYVQAALSVG